MDQSNKTINHDSKRRNRLHELLIALIHQQDNLELMDSQAPTLDANSFAIKDQDPARWLDQNRRIINKYQALVRSAITLDALLEAENNQ